jgi:hypothetical protein
MKISELAKATATKVEKMRYYERIALRYPQVQFWPIYRNEYVGPRSGSF